MSKMRAVIFYAPRDVRLEERPIPTPGPGEVVVKTGAALTCGTDFKAYRQGHKVLLGDLPSGFGHELAGTVSAVGKGVFNVKEGERVVVANSAPMDDCFWCKNGQNHLCKNLRLHNGAYADYDLVPAHIVRENLLPIPPAMKFETAALAEPLACAIHAAEKHQIESNETCVVIGAGPMSILLVSVLKFRGARVAVLGRSRPPLQTVAAAGADEVFSSFDEDVETTVRDWADGRGADHVFEAVGRAPTYQQAVRLVRNGGKVCFFGGCAQGTDVTFDAHGLHYRELTLHGVFHHNPRHFKRAIELLALGKVREDLLVSGEVALEKVPEFFAANVDKSIPKAVVRP